MVVEMFVEQIVPFHFGKGSKRHVILLIMEVTITKFLCFTHIGVLSIAFFSISKSLRLQLEKPGAVPTIFFVRFFINFYGLV